MSKQDLPVYASADCCASLTSPLSQATAVELAGAFKALADPVRLRLLSLITARAGEEVCVCELTPQFDLSQPTISHHLKVLREAGLIDCERRGTWVYYWVIPAALQQLSGVLRPTEDARVPARP
ncbi:ArsR/SmtB family transcription factor [Nocardia brasiliensis]|uniref:ArsR/SmtB family transcription factor n=1 Tax=Nocardia brasiliensis TaxID=37326 RepID=UPI0004A7315C|nr:metalloregulator ArsR/SmtB family transcription factor [Nocardia brasiliensis]